MQRCVERSAVTKLCMQHPQRRDVVDIVPGRQDMEGQVELAGAFDRLRRHSLSAPVDLLEHAPVRLLEAEQVIATVACWPEDGAITRLGEKVRRLHQQCCRQGGAVGIQHDGASMTLPQDFAYDSKEAVAEIRKPGFDESD